MNASAHPMTPEMATPKLLDAGSHAKAGVASMAIPDFTTLRAAFEGEGLLFHSAPQAQRTMPALGNRNQTLAQQTFSVEYDCGSSCSAWSLLRKDLPFAPFVPVHGQGYGLGVGFIAALDSFKDVIVSMTPTDADSNYRDCAWLKNSSSKARRLPPPTPSYVGACSGDEACRSYQAHTCADISSITSLDGVISPLDGIGRAILMNPKLTERGPLSRFCRDECYVHENVSDARIRSACGVCFGDTPYWCNGAFPNVTSAAGWMTRFTSGVDLHSDVSTSQCKFPREQWTTFLDTIKLWHSTRQQQALAGQPLQKAPSWNEINLSTPIFAASFEMEPSAPRPLPSPRLLASHCSPLLRLSSLTPLGVVVRSERDTQTLTIRYCRRALTTRCGRSLFSASTTSTSRRRG